MQQWGRLGGASGALALPCGMTELDFLFFSPIAWDNMEGAHRPARFASELARRGHRSTYIQLEKSQVKPRTENLRVYDLEELGLGERHVLAAFYGFDYGGMDDSRLALGRRLEEWEAVESNKIAILAAAFRPFVEFVPMLRSRGYRVLFDVHDDYLALRGTDYFCFDDAAEHYLARECDLALAVSPPLVEKMRAEGCEHVVLLKNGIDLEMFRQRVVPPMIEHGALTLGFWGWVWRHNVDVDLLSALARARPAWEIHLLGPFDESIAKELNLANIHWHGKIRREQIPAYGAQFDVCLLPAPDDAFNQARDPLKVYEYLACGKPVVATNLPQLAGMVGVYLSRNVTEFIANVERAAREHIDTARLSEFLTGQTWSARVETLLHELEAAPHRQRQAGPPPHGELPGAKNDLERWQAYAKHLERLVADREAHVDELEQALVRRGPWARVKRLLGR
jgi:glycosyltransferase involved in cell wall biosynthesis